MRHLLVWVCLLGQTLFAYAQESNYWTQQYGARSNMMGGAVVGGLEDNSALYYNPAALVFIKTSNLSLNTSAYQFTETYHHNGAGQGIDLFSRRVRLYPQMSSGLLTKNPESRFRLGFCVLSRFQNNLDANQRHEGYYNIVPFHPGDEYYVGSVELQNIFSDTWMGLGFSYRLSEHWSIGSSFFVSYRNQRYRSSIFARTSFEDGGISILSVYRSVDDIRLNNLKLIPKVGLHGRWGKWRLGFTITAPSISFWGESKVEREIALQNIQNNSDVLYIDQQKRVKTNYKYPMSVAGGIAYVTPNTVIGISAEFFMGLRNYQMIKAEPRAVIIPESLNNGTIDFLSVYNFANPVLNGAIGFEQRLSKIFKLHLGFRTDFSYRYNPPPFLNKFVDPQNPPNQKNIFLAPSLNLYHTSLGISITRRASLITFGIDYGLGIRNNIQQFTDLTNPQMNSLLQGEPSRDSRITHQIWTLLLGYTYYFALK